MQKTLITPAIPGVLGAFCQEMDKGQKYILQYYSFSLYSKMVFSPGVKVWIGTPFSTLKSCPLCSGPRYFWFQVSSHSYIIVPLYVMCCFFSGNLQDFLSLIFSVFIMSIGVELFVLSYLSSGVHGISWICKFDSHQIWGDSGHCFLQYFYHPVHSWNSSYM